MATTGFSVAKELKSTKMFSAAHKVQHRYYTGLGTCQRERFQASGNLEGMRK